MCGNTCLLRLVLRARGTVMAYMIRSIEKAITFCILKDISFMRLILNNMIVLKHHADVLNEIASQCLCSVFQAQGLFLQA